MSKAATQCLIMSFAGVIIAEFAMAKTPLKDLLK